MKKITLKSILAENYKSFCKILPGRNDLFCEFGQRTKISGRNREGKSTILDVFFDVLTGRLADGTQPDKVRPHDKNGIDIDRIDIVRGLNLEIDGKPVDVVKKTSQKWRKPRGRSEEVFDGNLTTYSIDGFEQKQKDFQRWQESIADPDVLLMCSNARPFLNAVKKSTADARKILERMSGFKMEDFIAQNPEYAQIDDITKGHSVEDAMKQLRKNLNAQKKVAETVKTQLSYEKNRDVSNDANVSELEQKIAELNQQISELDKQEAELDEVIKAYDVKSSKLMDLKFQQSEIVRKSNIGLVSKKKELEDKEFSLEQEKKSCENSLRMAELDLKHATMAVERHTAEVKRAQEDWNTYYSKEYPEENIAMIESETFDEESLVCPTCGRKYPEDQAEKIRLEYEHKKMIRIKNEESIRDKFYQLKDEKLNEIKDSGNKSAADLREARKVKEESEQKIEELKGVIASYAMQINQVREETAGLPESVEMSDNAEYQKITKEIADSEELLKQMSNSSERRMEIRGKRSAMEKKVLEYTMSIKKSEADNKEKDRLVSELEQKLKMEGQKCADIERKIDLLTNFSIEKNKALADMVNPYFKHFQFVFYDTTIEGNIYETLRIMCDGTDFFSGLNRSDQILCEIDLVCGLQKLNNLNLPVWVDNSEAVNADRLPEIEQQMIVLEVSNEPLKVEVI